jgi:hypothetical protein
MPVNSGRYVRPDYLGLVGAPACEYLSYSIKAPCKRGAKGGTERSPADHDRQGEDRIADVGQAA